MHWIDVNAKTRGTIPLGDPRHPVRVHANSPSLQGRVLKGQAAEYLTAKVILHWILQLTQHHGTHACHPTRCSRLSRANSRGTQCQSAGIVNRWSKLQGAGAADSIFLQQYRLRPQFQQELIWFWAALKAHGPQGYEILLREFYKRWEGTRKKEDPSQG